MPCHAPSRAATALQRIGLVWAGLAAGLLLGGFGPMPAEARSVASEQATRTAPARQSAPRRPAASSTRRAPARGAPARISHRRPSGTQVAPPRQHVTQKARAVSGLRHGIASVRGTEASLLLAIAAQESSLDPAAGNSRSSARGLMQFTRDTWLEAVREHGARHGLGHLARQLTRGPDGRITAAKPRTIDQVLALRDNPRISAVLAAERLAAAQRQLEGSLGRELGATDLYLVHLLGHAGAQRYLRALTERPATAAAEVVGPAAAAANPEVFGHADDRLTVAGAYRRIGERLAAQLAVHARILATLAQPVELAEAR
jgi:hypothetical protein